MDLELNQRLNQEEKKPIVKKEEKSLDQQPFDVVDDKSEDSDIINNPDLIRRKTGLEGDALEQDGDQIEVSSGSKDSNSSKELCQANSNERVRDNQNDQQIYNDLEAQNDSNEVPENNSKAEESKLENQL